MAVSVMVHSGDVKSDNVHCLDVWAVATKANIDLDEYLRPELRQVSLLSWWTHQPLI